MDSNSFHRRHNRNRYNIRFLNTEFDFGSLAEVIKCLLYIDRLKTLKPDTSHI